MPQLHPSLRRAYVQETIVRFVAADQHALLGQLTEHHGHTLELTQRDAWRAEIEHLQGCLVDLDGTILLEFAIPRMGKRADVVLLIRGVVFVLEYKVGATEHDLAAMRQCLDYALDLKYFHQGTHDRRVIPIVVATNATPRPSLPAYQRDGVAEPVRANSQTLRAMIEAHLTTDDVDAISVDKWIDAPYKPTPTIIEAARALYAGHGVEQISRSEAGATNLASTANAIASLIESAKAEQKKTICFITGVPGSGKTLAGLNIATQRMRGHEDEHAVFLSGNGPLVNVLREALTRDELSQPTQPGQPRRNKESAQQRARTFIQNIHHFRDESLRSPGPPSERVVVFDEAQRAWDLEQTQKFMREKRSIPDFTMSEPEFLLSVMDRHDGWCVVVCLVGNGQEINTGEAGINEWFAALERRFPHWRIACSEHLADAEPSLASREAVVMRDLHLQVSLRSFRAEQTAAFVSAVITGDAMTARQQLPRSDAYPIVLTRSLETARDWLRSRARGSERTGLIASSGGLRLKPCGIFVKTPINPVHWFLNDETDVRSSFALEDVATEFDTQGLELDWVGVCWDANFRYEHGGWVLKEFRGTKWSDIHDEQRRTYLANSYRVLLTRARQGMVIFVPHGNVHDRTRPPSFFDPTFEFLVSVGLQTV